MRDLLNGGVRGDYRCVYVNVEPGQAARENQAEAMRAIFSELEIEAEATLDIPLPARLWPDLPKRAGPADVQRTLEASRDWRKMRDCIDDQILLTDVAFHAATGHRRRALHHCLMR